MPRRNVLKIDSDDSYYHIYTRGVNKQPVFAQAEDYKVFLNLLKRYLSISPTKDKNGAMYPHFYSKLELLCFCLMPNHIHLLVYQKDKGAMQSLMRGVMTSYSRYFNKSQARSGPLFESRYKASRVDKQTYLEHISRYIHLNPRSWRNYAYSSLPYFVKNWHAEWLMPGRVLNIFRSPEEYKNFLKDYESYKQTLDEIKAELADT